MKILSQGEFRNFQGVSYMGNKPVYTVNIEDTKPIRCTSDHKFLTDGGEWMQAIDMTPDHVLYGKNFINCEPAGYDEPVYDIIEVEDTNSYTVEGVEVHNCAFLYLDECAFIEGYDEFFASVYPTISSGENTKLLMTSTPKGLNHFYKTCKGAEEGTNGYEFVKVMWNDVPGRGEKWKKETLEALDHDEEKFNQEYCCVKGNTLVTVRAKTSGKVSTMSIEKLYEDQLSGPSKMQDKYEILTPDGFSHFHGVRKQIATGIIKISFENAETIECSLDHKFQMRCGFIEAKNLAIGDEIQTSEGFTNISFIHKDDSEIAPVYDALHVEKGHKYYTNGLVSHNCQFIGSSGTLISGHKLKNLSPFIPIAQSEGIKQYDKPQKERIYTLIADVSRGKGLDYSTFSIMDVTEMPYKQVCAFRDNFIGPVDFASIIFRFANLYNEAYVMVEINDIGGQVSDVLYLDFGYENLIFTENAGRSGKRVSGGFGKNVDRGVRTTKSVKSIGCSILKMLIEQEQMIVCDFDTIQELSRFSKKGASYEAESGAHDDMVMTLVLFSWLVEQTYFKDITDINTIMRLKEKTDDQLDSELLPFGFIQDGREDDGAVNW
jgi:hypothetical protein